MNTMIKLIRSMLVVGWLIVLLGAMGSASAIRAEVEPRMRAPALYSGQASFLTYQWHTFYGVTDSVGRPRSIAVDAVGNVYVAGYTNRSWGSPLHAYSGDYDVMVVKLNSLGQYQWHTYYGASPTSSEDGDDEGASIAVDASGNVSVTGYSDRTWQGPGNIAPLHPHGGDAEYMFVLKLNSSGAYQWHTFYQPGRPNAIAVDGSSNVYVTGYASAKWGSPLHTSSGNLVVLKLNSSGARQWHTYYGAGASAADEVGYGVAVAPSGSAVYITGSAPDTWLGDGNAAPLHPFSGGAGYSTDILLLKLSTSGSYQWHTFYGAGTYDDFSYGIAVDGGGDPYIAGYSYHTWGAPLHAHGNERDIAVLKLNANGAYQWHTFYGSGSNDIGTAIVLDGSSNPYITGWSAASWQGDSNASPSHPHSGGANADIVVLKLNSSGAYQRHTFYGATGLADEGLSIALDSNHGVFTTGSSVATWQGDGGANPLHAHSGNHEGDGFVLKLSNRVYNVYLPLITRQ